MRLLSSEWSEKPTFRHFKADPPPYAILSHTWGESEVSFEDLTHGLGKEKNGYRKIEFCANQAKRDKLQFFWADTCCINKWDSLERSKAINSMFRWYRNAARCYVFLTDVSVPDATDISRQDSWESSFEKSKWFTRGWTLQELIAPASVKFFSSEGHFLGDKGSLGNLICKITGLSAQALYSHNLVEFSVSERRKWARNRETTEPEDNVYCLLGILNVFMPASYGEGQENAWNRLEDELARIGKAPFMVPFTQNNRFVGYQSQLAELEGKAFASKQTIKIAITGPGGIGKSQLALELAHRTRQRYQNCSVFWISAGDEDSFRQACSEIAQKLEIPGWDDENEDARNLVKFRLSKEDAGQWLIIYDDAGEADDTSLNNDGVRTFSAATLLDFIPHSEQGCIIFTTISSDTAERVAPRNVIELMEMTPDTAQRMLESHLTSSSKAETQLLLQELSYLPLGITQAAAFIKYHNISIIDYLELLYKQKKNADPVTKTLLISLERIACDNAPAVDILFFMGCVYRKDILQDLLPTPSSERKEAMELLSTYALITRRPANSAVELHRLVHVALRSYLEEQGILYQCNQKAVSVLIENFPGPGHENRSKWRRLLPHTKYALAYNLGKQQNDSTTTLARVCARALYKDGRYNEAEELQVQVMETRKTKLGADHPSTLTSMANLASTYMSQGRLEAAEKLEMQVMETRKTKLGADHPSTLTSMANLASTFWNQGRWEAAEKLDVQVMETRKTKLGADHPSTLTSMANLAATYRNQGRWEAAEKLNVQVMETRKTKLGADHPDTLTSMANLASTYMSQNRWEAAEKLEVQVMETRKTKLGADHPDTLSSMANLAATFWNQGRWEAAEELQVQVMETRKTKLGADHPSTLTSMNNLAFTWKAQDRDLEALNLLRECVNLQRQKLGSNHPNFLSSLEALTQWGKDKLEDHHHQERHEEAEAIEESLQ